jgi:hypothetical protein
VGEVKSTDEVRAMCDALFAAVIVVVMGSTDLENPILLESLEIILLSVITNKLGDLSKAQNTIEVGFVIALQSHGLLLIELSEEIVNAHRSDKRLKEFLRVT